MSVTLCTKVVPLRSPVISCQLRTIASVLPTSSRMRLKCDGTRAETRSRLSTQRTSPFKSAGASVQSTTGSRAVHISLQGLYCSCKPVLQSCDAYWLPTALSCFPFTSPPCVTACHHIPNAVYHIRQVPLDCLHSSHTTRNES
jgi:hypothetical protein